MTKFLKIKNLKFIKNYEITKHISNPLSGKRRGAARGKLLKNQQTLNIIKTTHNTYYAFTKSAAGKF